jgi:hypothetical protein
MNRLVSAIAKSGVLDGDLLKEFRRWGLPVDAVEPPARPASLQELSQLIQTALEEEDLVITKVTDLEVVKAYMSTQKKGRLHIITDEGKSTAEVTFGRNRLGEYIIPWRSETIQNEIANGFTFLKDGTDKVFFSDVQEIFFGDEKVFMVCKPAPRGLNGDRT